MENLVFVKKLSPIEINKKEILRYAGAKEATDEIEKLLNSCLDECKDAFEYKTCYMIFDTEICGDELILGDLKIKSKSLCALLENCPQTVLFAATVGLKIDRLILKNSVQNLSRAHLLGAIGTERIESLCDAFCAEFKDATRRVSAGYGDLPLEIQPDIFALLDCNRKIGLSLNDSLVMTPTKSVTAIFGLGRGEEINKCSLCDSQNCSFRR